LELNYSHGAGPEKNWVVEEQRFDRDAAGNMESLFCLGNGYMGIRATTEERYSFETKGFFVAGLFDALHGNDLNLEVSELANSPDWLATEIILDGEPFTLTEGRPLSYSRRLNMRSGELVREIEWESPKGRVTKLSFHRFISVASLHIAGLRISVVPLNYSGTLDVRNRVKIT
jgi:trehalose/maltose hydrolase-like predicted phosphorylase